MLRILPDVLFAGQKLCIVGCYLIIQDSISVNGKELTTFTMFWELLYLPTTSINPFFACAVTYITFHITGACR